MRIVVHGPASGYGPRGFIESWSPDQAVDIDDGDSDAVAWARSRAETGLVEIVEDSKKPARKEVVQDGKAERGSADPAGAVG